MDQSPTLEKIEREEAELLARLQELEDQKKLLRPGRGRPRKPDDAFERFFLMWVTYRQRHRSLSAKAATSSFLRKYHAEIEELGIVIGSYRRALNVRHKGQLLLWERRLARLFQSEERQFWEEMLRRPAGKRIFAISAKSFGE